MKTDHFDEAALFASLKHHLPTQAALKDFVHHNPLHSFQEMEFFKAIFSASKIFGIKPTFSMNEYRRLHQAGRIDSEIIERMIRQEKAGEDVELWQEKLLRGSYPHV